MREECDDFPIHLFVGKAQVDDILDEVQKHHTSAEAVGLDEVVEQSKADLIREDRQVFILEDFASLKTFLPKCNVFLVHSICYFFELLSKDSILVHHLEILYKGGITYAITVTNMINKNKCQK